MKKNHFDRPMPSQNTAQTPLLSVVTPAYNEADNLPLLYDKLCQALNSLSINWEWIIVDDHSTDKTYDVIKELAGNDPRVRGIRFSRNFGSHTALTCGLHHTRGKCATIMAADLQDPPETLSELLTQWHEGADVVWAVRQRREGVSSVSIGFSRMYYFLMRHAIGIKEIPATGADFFLIDRKVIEALRQFHENHVSILALISWMGFRQTYIFYDKRKRLHGESGWTLEKKLRLVMDSIVSFSYFPVRLISYVGIIVALLGISYAAYVVMFALWGYPPEGWSSIMVAILVLGGIQMLMMGILGEYVWRSLDESRQRPHYLIETTTESQSSTKSYE